MPRNAASSLVKSLLTLTLAACSGASVDYNVADPIADAQAALAVGNFHLVAVRVGESVISPIDSAYESTTLNVEVGPDGPVRYLTIVTDPGSPNAPSRAQFEYMKRFNTEMFRMVEANARAAGRP